MKSIITLFAGFLFGSIAWAGPQICITSGATHDVCSPATSTTNLPDAGETCPDSELTLQANPEEFSGIQSFFVVFEDEFSPSPYTNIWYGPFYNDEPFAISAPGPGAYRVFMDYVTVGGANLQSPGFLMDVTAPPTANLVLNTGFSPTTPCVKQLLSNEMHTNNCFSAFPNHYSIDMGDGTAPYTGTACGVENFKHQYTSAGIFLPTVIVTNTCGIAQTTVGIIIANCRTAVGGQLEAGEPEAMAVEVYPNPSSNWVNLVLTGVERTSEVQLTLTNVEGQVVARFQLQPDQDKLEMDLSDFAPGMYLLQSQSDALSLNYKIMKQ